MSRDKDFIPRKPKKPTRLKLQPEKVEIPDDLKDLWAHVIAISTTHRMLQEGMFPFRFNQALQVSLAYVTNLHKEAFAKCWDHPEKHLIPEIGDIKKEQDRLDVAAAGSSNGKAQEQ